MELIKESERMGLYQQGLTDREIADILGVKPSAIGAWRACKNLPLHPAGNYSSHVPMGQALTPKQCKMMKQFLAKLVATADNAAGKRIDVGAFIKAYRNSNELFEEAY